MAYILDVFAKSACAVHILLFALSFFICCSLVCKDILKASTPFLSIDFPIIRPGNNRKCLSFIAKKAEWGPPFHKGNPNR